jgi:hypothetical protein
MEKEGDKFSIISEIYSQFSEENKEKLVKIARTLLKVQKDAALRITDTSLPIIKMFREL